jgi:hypothetical protein
MLFVTKIKTEDCALCEGSGRRFRHGPRHLSCRCVSCGGTGQRYVPEGYTQEQVEAVRSLVDAMAVQRGIA